MAISSRTRWVARIAVSLVLLALPSAADAQLVWEKVPSPKVGGFEASVGSPNDLRCWSRNRCVLLTGGTTAFSDGVFAYNGVSLREYATVCGKGSADTGRVVWAGPTEFWTITVPSSPLDRPPYDGFALCHFVGGQVVGSYSTVRALTGGQVDVPADDPYKRMAAGACSSPNDCWFAGVAGATPDNSRVGTFNLHWDGSSLRTVYAPAKRAAVDVENFAGGFTEAVISGPALGQPVDPTLGDLPAYRMFQSIGPGATSAGDFSADDFQPAAVAGLPGDVTEPSALDAESSSAEGHLWAVGGGATSGADALPPGSGRGPFAAFRTSADPDWTELDLTAGGFSPDARFVDVAALPGTDEALVAVAPTGAAGLGGPATVARIDSSGDVTLLGDALNGAGAGVGNAGDAARIDCPTAVDCLLVTASGVVYRMRDDSAPTPSADTEPAFAGVVSYRPNELAAQGVDDSAPTDDSLLFAPPPVAEQQEVTNNERTLKAAARRFKSKLRGRTLIFTFKVYRKTKVRITLKRGARTVATKKTRYLRTGWRHMRFRLSIKRWPTKVYVKLFEPRKSDVSVATARCPVGGGPCG